MAANAVTATRMIAAFLLFLIDPSDPVFWLLYAWCGASDMIDGQIARRLEEESLFGARLDSVSDFTFAVACCCSILPNCSLQAWLVALITLIASSKILLYVFLLGKGSNAARMHSMGNKAAGFTVFVTLPALYLTKMSLVALPACIVSAISIFQEARTQNFFNDMLGLR